ncbi:hypothetical protein Srot_0649 [Segniliparus rotundus DSM 44985]|uniref:Uncharacterized protein n=1 Tax=Segniliparus rotundus (strain ATCC BAA-972 / CDC 1076 / CIP 108378 / DSM 44985 / JCM 13578) TaxID=640132 RepID=D6ZCT9_SEGRD|nr:hypothetical protein [Segniliparus rotundus]ADG97131.1 hypothetical protein Srot_0649 [Segniliparus rotundus DSM 44985]
MTNQKLAMESADFRAAGHRLHNVGESLAAAYAAFCGEAAQQGNPWGSDQYGTVFAQGEGKYLSGMRNMQQAAEGETGYLALLRKLGENTVAAADQVEAEDEANAADLEAERSGLL